MVPEPDNPVTVLGQCQVSPWPSPPAGKPRSLPLTFYDLAFWDVPPVQRLFFYDNTDLLGGPEFLLSELPLFEKSLAAALHHFYPLAGKLPCGMPEAAAPEIVFSDGDSVRLTVAVGDDNFEDLAGDHPRDTARLRALLPPLLRNGGGGSQCSQDVLAIQLTVFPLAGICIGTTLHHAVCDGSSYVHFMRTWAAIHRCGLLEHRGGKSMAVQAPPLFDRSVVQDNDGLREVFLSDHRAYAAAGDCDHTSGTTELATFRFTDRLLRWLGKQVESDTSARRCSPYALACGAMWAGIVRARGSSASFGFVTGCKPRASPPIPASYFGNCLGLCRVEEKMEAKQSCLEAVIASAAAIWRTIEGLAEQGRVFRDARGWVRLVREYASARAVTVAGSPKLGVYAAADLGPPWGRPRKVEIVSVERTGALALAESGRDGDGGIEVGLALPRGEMEAFRAFYAELLLVAAA
ncbi:hypothetical protein ACQ4PT_008959 [Festuca glaucescens]